MIKPMTPPEALRHAANLLESAKARGPSPVATQEMREALDEILGVARGLSDVLDPPIEWYGAVLRSGRLGGSRG